MTALQRCGTRCGRPAHDGALCPPCSGQLARNLHTIAALWPDLLDAIGGGLTTRPARPADADMERCTCRHTPEQHRDTPASMPCSRCECPNFREQRSEEVGSVIPTGIDINWKASGIARDAREAVAAWGSECGIAHGTLPQVCDGLAQHIRVLRRTARPAIDAADLRTRIEHAIDPAPPPMTELGHCTRTLDGTECRARLAAPPGRAIIDCPRCGWRYPVHETQQWLLAQADNLLATTTEIHLLGVTLAKKNTIDGTVVLAPIRFKNLQDRITHWVRTGQLAAHGHELPARGGRPRPRYRIGDVRALLDRVHA